MVDFPTGAVNQQQKPIFKEKSLDEMKKFTEKVTLMELLKQMMEQNASDLHVTVGSPPQIRVDGELKPMTKYVSLSADKAEQLAYSALTDKQKKEFEQKNELDLSFAVKGVSRFRANIFKQRGTVAAAFRSIPFEILDFKTLGLPRVVSERLVKLPKGLILVTGPTGCGKSTTLASIIDSINKSRHSHIITIEDPIEYIHKHIKCIVNQREVGADTISFPVALKYVLREDPDIILIGEMRDLETIESAITIAETGHLVFATLHTNSAIESVNRIIDVFPAHQQPQVRTQLSFVLQGIITQQLIPHAPPRTGRVLCCEVLIPTPAIRNMVRENKIHQIYSSLQTGMKFGMQTMNVALFRLWKRGAITKDEAFSRTMMPEELREMMNRGIEYVK